MTTNPLPPPRFAWDWAGWWTLVFVCNLPVPLILGLVATRSGGQVGLFGGLAVVYWVGFVLNGWRLRVGRPLTLGGIWVGALQFIPVLQLGCGCLAGWAWWQVSGVEFGTSVPTEAGGRVLVAHNVGAFLAVLVAAVPLCTVALLVDTFERWLRGEFTSPRRDV